MKNYTILLLLGFIILYPFNVVLGEPEDPIIAEITNLIFLGESASPEQVEVLKSKIEKNSKQVLPTLFQKLEDPVLSEKALAFRIWAIGLTKAPEAVDAIIGIAKRKSSETVLNSAYSALAMIGGDKAGQFLLDKLKDTTDLGIRFNLFNSLAQMQYQPALSLTSEILAKEPKTFYWQSVFIFGKFGDVSIPFLLEKIADKNSDIKENAINILGQWLIAPKVAAPLKLQYGKESNPKIRMLMLSAMERTNSDLDDLRLFFSDIIRKEKNGEVLKFAKEALASFETLKNSMSMLRSKKIDDRSLFETEYDRLYQSCGEKGNYQNLSAASLKMDEKKLKKLREVILQRNSDECFDDYQKITTIIVINRFLNI